VAGRIGRNTPPLAAGTRRSDLPAPTPGATVPATTAVTPC